YEPAAFLSDVRGHWGLHAIAASIDRGIVDGYPDLTFRPEAQTTRAEFAVMLSRALKLEGGVGILSFKDKDSIPDWAGPAVKLAVDAGLINGYEDGTFRPDSSITRAEIVTMVARALKSVQTDKEMATSFADGGEIPSWAKAAVSRMVEAGIIQGRDNNRFAPADQATRAEAVKILIALGDLEEANE
ncbi:MAG: xynA5, partial [Paenibacillus sp.]|nr:xynA5 [Paenibacillus sp.]